LNPRPNDPASPYAFKYQEKAVQGRRPDSTAAAGIGVIGHAREDN
jgi:hypothetical protein